MTAQQAMQQIFERLLAGDVPEAEILTLVQTLTPADTVWLMEHVETLQGPQDYMAGVGAGAGSGVVADGFFKYIDLVAGIILTLGDRAVAEARRFEDSDAHYVPWVLRYCTDSRFAAGLKESFPFLKL